MSTRTDVPGAIPGWLELRGLRCPGRHGAYEGEQDVEQPFMVDLAVRLADLRPAADADDLQATVDLAALAATAREIVAGPSRAILETVTLEIVRAILERFPPVAAVRVRLAKLDPPGLEATEEAIEITLDRAGGSLV